ncbi:ABA4-like family protein [Actinokineospora inagensis]|uniref:ABA4-like family protein n=1 Tax=Actinokineospora inagensis TaxID=103730 RepID=UPI00041B8430|nr:ABA4-like family protein [Actinokineospora inagensis]
MSTLFSLAFAVAAPFWLLMIVAPTWTWTRRIAGSPLIVLPGLVVWAIAAIPVFGTLVADVTNPDLAKWLDFLRDDNAVTLVWAQVLAWDLFIGRWIYLDSRERGVHPLLMAPVLVLTILLSPIGLPVYLLVRLGFRAPGTRSRVGSGA